MPYINYLLLFFTLTTIACNRTSDKNEFICWVNSYKIACTGMANRMCLQVQRGDQMEPGQWENFYNEIQGFDWQPGYLYKLRVRENRIPPSQVPADASSIKYTLVKILQEKKDPVTRLHDIWALESLDGKQWNSKTLERPTLEINLTSRKIMGTDGCNRYHGDIQKVTPKELVPGSLSSTKKACPDMVLSNLFMNKMKEVRGYRLNQLKMTLLDKNSNKLMQLKKVD